MPNSHLWLQIAFCRQQPPQAEQMRIVDRPKPSIISSLSLLLHMKTDSQQIRSPTSPMAVKVVSTSAVNCIGACVWHVEMLVIYCSLEVSSCNNSLCHQINSLHCNNFSYYKFLLHRSVLKIHMDPLTNCKALFFRYEEPWMNDINMTAVTTKTHGWFKTILLFCLYFF